MSPVPCGYRHFSAGHRRLNAERPHQNTMWLYVRNAKHVTSTHVEVARGSVLRSHPYVDGCARPRVSSRFNDDEGGDGMLQEDGWRLPHGVSEPSVLREECGSTFSRSNSATAACAACRIYSRHAGQPDLGVSDLLC